MDAVLDTYPILRPDRIRSLWWLSPLSYQLMSTLKLLVNLIKTLQYFKPNSTENSWPVCKLPHSDGPPLPGHHSHPANKLIHFCWFSLTMRSCTMVTSCDSARLLVLDLWFTNSESWDGKTGESVLTSKARDDTSVLRGLNSSPSLTGVSLILLSHLPWLAKLDDPVSPSSGVVARLSDCSKG